MTTIVNKARLMLVISTTLLLACTSGKPVDPDKMKSDAGKRAGMFYGYLSEGDIEAARPFVSDRLRQEIGDVYYLPLFKRRVTGKYDHVLAQNGVADWKNGSVTFEVVFTFQGGKKSMGRSVAMGTAGREFHRWVRGPAGWVWDGVVPPPARD